MPLHNMTTPIYGSKTFIRRYKDRCKYDGHPLDEQQICALEKTINKFFVLENSSIKKDYKESVWLFRTMNSFDDDTLIQIATEAEIPKPPEDRIPHTVTIIRRGIENYRLVRSGRTASISITNADTVAFYEFIAARINRPDFQETWKQYNQSGQSTYETIEQFTHKHFEILCKYLHRKELIKESELSKLKQT